MPARRDLLDLPDNVVDEILCLAPIDEAVRTSTLSRGWRHRWRSIPNLDLGFCPFNDTPRFPDVSDVLRQHTGSLRLFRAQNFKNCSVFNVRSWIQTLTTSSASSLRVLNLANPNDLKEKIQLPALFRHFPRLTELRLDGFFIEAPPASDDFSPFPSLNVLELEHGNFCSGLPYSMYVPPCPSLETLGLSFNGSLSFDLCSIARSFPRLSDLTIFHGTCLKPLSDPDFSTAAFPVLRTLFLGEVRFDEHSAFIPACPSLETLGVHSEFGDKEPSVVFCASNFPYLRSFHLSNCSLQLLPDSFPGISYLRKDHPAWDKSPGQLSKILSASPLLEQLVLLSPFASGDYLNIAAVNLQYLCVDFLDSFAITVAPVLKKAYINASKFPCYDSREVSGYDNFMKIFGDMHSIEKLQIGGRTMKVCS